MDPRSTPRFALLLVEPDSLLRRTVAGVSRELGFADVHEATSVDAGERLVGGASYDALLLALDPGRSGLDLVARLRRGETACAGDIRVALMAESCDAALALRLKELDVRRLLLKPFKVKSVLETIAGLAAARV